MRAIDHISEAMIALVNASKVLQDTNPQPRPPVPSEGLRLSLTDEKSPVRVQHGETWMDLTFTEAAALLLSLHQIGQVREIAEELQNG